MKHVVIGGGNLGCDIVKYGRTNEMGRFKLFTASNGFRYPTSIDPILDELPDHVWLPIGAGSVEGAKKDFTTYADLHIRLVMELAQKLPSRVWLHTFSSNYVTSPTESLYSYSKYTMEGLLGILLRERTRIYRVQSLYGWDKPLKCFPFRLIKNHPKPDRITLPVNLVVPTPTQWLAEVLLHNLPLLMDTKYHVDYNVAPEGAVPVFEWAQLILGNEYEVVANGIDTERPEQAKPGCDFMKAPDWRELWDKHWGGSNSQVRKWKAQVRGVV